MDKKNRLHLEEIELTQDEVLELLVGGKPIEGFKFYMELEGFGERVVYVNEDETLKRVYDLETGEFLQEYSSKNNPVFHNPERATKMVYVASRLQFYGKNGYTDSQRNQKQ